MRTALKIAMMSNLAYWARLKNVFGSSLISYLPMTEMTGSVAADASGNNRPGAYTGVDLWNAVGPDGKKFAPLFDGVNDYLDWYSASLAAAFDPTAFTLLAWLKVYNSGVWTDGTARYIIYGRADGNNFASMQRDATHNQLGWTFKAGGTTKVVAASSQSTLNWFAMAMTIGGGEFKAYLKTGSSPMAQNGATVTGLGTWVGALNAATTLIGANAKTPTQVWYGWIQYVALINGAATLAQLINATTI